MNWKNVMITLALLALAGATFIYPGVQCSHRDTKATEKVVAMKKELETLQKVAAMKKQVDDLAVVAASRQAQPQGTLGFTGNVSPVASRPAPPRIRSVAEIQGDISSLKNDMRENRKKIASEIVYAREDKGAPESRANYRQQHIGDLENAYIKMCNKNRQLMAELQRSLPPPR